MSVLVALVLVPALVGAGLCLAGSRADRVAASAGVGTAVVAVMLAVVAAVQRPAVSAVFVAGSPFGLRVDALSALVLVTVAAVTLLVLVFASGDDPGSPARFHGLMLIFAAAVVVTATATTLPALLAAWEVMGATSYALIGFWWREPHRVSAGATALLTTRAGDLGLYAAAGAALAGGGGLALADLPAASPGWRHLIAAGVLLAALGKAAQLPFSFWLSRAMEGPSPVSALLHSAAMVAMGGYLLLRVEPLLAVTGWAATAAAWAGAVTAVLLGVVALAQRDLKQLLAASTAAQLGFVVAAAGVGAVAGGAAQLVAHAATKALLFLAAGAWLSALGTKQLPALRGAARRWPALGVASGVGLLALAGAPPLSLWATKDEILAAAREVSLPLHLVLLVAAALSAGYAGLALVQVWRRPVATTPDGWDEEQDGTRHAGVLEHAPVLVLSVGAALLGLLALPPLSDRVRAALGATDEPTASAAGLAGSAVLVLAVLAAVVAVAAALDRTDRTVRAPAWATGWLGLERAAHRAVVRPVWRLAEMLARFDDGVLDRGVHAAAALVGSGARGLGRVDVRGIAAAVESMAAAVLRAGALARRPQTGQLHHYYLQAVVLIAGAVVLLVLT